MKLVIDEQIDDKIRYLCNKINDKEWSGLLLYITKGTIKDPENMEFIAQDIIPMDVGTGASTEYKIHETDGTDRHMDYCFKHPEALEWRIGGIHSHNSMKVFFSGTDTAELKENAKRHNLYLSVVVNNAHDIIAKVVQQIYGEAEIPCYGLGENGQKEQLETKKYVIDELREWDLTIDSPLVNDVDDEFKEAVEAIIPKPKVITSSGLPVDSYFQSGYDYFEDDYEPKFSFYHEPNPPATILDSDEEENTDEEKMVLLALGRKENDDLDAVLDGLESDKKITPQHLKLTIMKRYGNVVRKFSDLKNPFEYMVYDFIDFLDDLSIYYPKLKATVKELNKKH